MAKKKGESSVKIYLDWCKGCGICAAFCPSKVLKINNQGKAEVINEGECINCGFCEVHCPDFAILVRPKNEVKKNNPGTKEKNEKKDSPEKTAQQSIPTSSAANIEQPQVN